MEMNQVTPFQNALDAVDSLSLDAREEIIGILLRRLAEDRREEIAANASEAIASVKEKRAMFGSVEDLKKDITGD